MPTLKAIIRELNADSAITAKLSVFNFGAGDAPAIFAGARPVEAAMKSIVVNMISGTDFGSNGLIGARVQHDVRVEDDKIRSEKDCREVAWSIWEKFHKKEIAVDGYSGGCPCWALSPQKITGPDGFPGYLVQVTVWILKEM